MRKPLGGRNRIRMKQRAAPLSVVAAMLIACQTSSVSPQPRNTTASGHGIEFWSGATPDGRIVTVQLPSSVISETNREVILVDVAKAEASAQVSIQRQAAEPQVRYVRILADGAAGVTPVAFLELRGAAVRFCEPSHGGWTHVSEPRYEMLPYDYCTVLQKVATP